MSANIQQVKRKKTGARRVNLEDYFFLNIQDHSKTLSPQFTSSNSTSEC